jgi:hypothetical protein
MGAPGRSGRREPRGPDPTAGEASDRAAASLQGSLAGTIAARLQEPSASARQRRRRAWYAVGGGLAIAVILVVAATAYYVRDAGSHASDTDSPTSYYGTLGTGLSAARASYWSWPATGPSLVFAVGLDSPASLGPALNATHLGTVTCLPTLISTTAQPLPPFTGNVTSGLAPEWLYAFLATGNALVVIAVVNGTAEVVATTPSNGGCYNGPTAFTTVPVDSTDAAGVAGSTAASSRFFANASANLTPVSAEFFLAPPGYDPPPPPPSYPIWYVTDTTCQLYGTQPSSGSILASEVNAGNGTLVSQTTTTVSC